MGKLKQIQALYAQIPSFTCKEGCTDCCGPIPFAKAEWAAVKDQRKATCIDCPYSMNGKCDIYENRPFICRIFGASLDPMLVCPHGCRPEHPLTKAASDKITEQYFKLMN